MQGVKTCSRCGEEKPLEGFYAKGRICRVCTCRTARARRQENLERYRGYSNKRREDPAFVEQQREYHRRWYVENREKQAAKQRAYYVSRREERIAKALEWAKANPDKRRTINLADKQRRRGLTVTAESKSYIPVLLADPCAYCGGKAGEIDHITAVTDCGSGEWSNLTAACRSCNARKQTRSLLQYLIAA
jgi:5-methylcytosine-specific restriction endonuclease McrA